MSPFCVVVRPVAVAVALLPELSVGVTSNGLVASTPEYPKIAPPASALFVQDQLYVVPGVSAAVTNLKYSACSRLAPCVRLLPIVDQPPGAVIASLLRTV